MVIDWKKIEICYGQTVPTNIKIFLDVSGYDSLLSIKRIDEEKINALEHHIQNRVQNDRNILEALDKNDKTTSIYKSQIFFEILPGHRTILLILPDIIEKLFDSTDELSNMQLPNNLNNLIPNEYSVILSQLITSANNNRNKSKNAYQYDDVLKDFSTYIFLLCGRTCYETLNRNLPIPSTKTICE